jgi:hypothetical protein
VTSAPYGAGPPQAPLDYWARITTKLRREQRDVHRLADTAEALLATVWADPRADEPPLPYAEWLLRRGVPHKALIAAQVLGSQARQGPERFGCLISAIFWLAALATLTRDDAP